MQNKCKVNGRFLYVPEPEDKCDLLTGVPMLSWLHKLCTSIETLTHLNTARFPQKQTVLIKHVSHTVTECDLPCGLCSQQNFTNRDGQLRSVGTIIAKGGYYAPREAIVLWLSDSLIYPQRSDGQSSTSAWLNHFVLFKVDQKYHWTISLLKLKLLITGHYFNFVLIFKLSICTKYYWQ